MPRPIETAPPSAENSPATAQQAIRNLPPGTAAGTGNQVPTVGFVITGLESKPVLVRAVGPALRALGVTTALAAPRLDLRSSTALLATNTGWSTGCHLHFTILVNGTAVDPMNWLP